MNKKSELSYNLVAAGLFDVAYRLAILRPDFNVLVELFRFCAIALDDAEFDVVSYAVDALESEEAVERARLLMASCEHDVESVRDMTFAGLEQSALAAGLAKVVGMQSDLGGIRSVSDFLAQVQNACGGTARLH